MLMALTGHARAKLAELKRSTPYSIRVTLIRGTYYFYEYTYVKADGRRKLETFYIGRMLPSGEFEAARSRYSGSKAKNLGELLAEKYGREEFRAHNAKFPSRMQVEILTSLSMNSRASLSSIAKEFGVSESSLDNMARRLGRTYGIKRTIEIRPYTFNFSRYIVTVKFQSGMPPRMALRRLFDDEPRIQIALLLTGGLDIVLFVVAESTMVLEDMIYRMRSSPIFDGFPGEWNIGYLIGPAGWFIPTRGRFFDMLKDKVWVRSRENPRRLPGQLTRSEYAVLKEMCLDAGTNFASIDSRYGLNPGSARYTYDKLVENGTIERTTIVMTKPQNLYSAFIYLKQNDMLKFIRYREESLAEIIEDKGYPVNKFAYIGNTSSPYGTVLIAPVYEQGGLESLREELDARVRGTEQNASVITDVLLGDIGYRRIDTEESEPAEVLRELAKTED